MPSLFKYIPSKYADAFVDQGSVLFRSLMYFKSYEDGAVRGDRYEGTFAYTPQGGLEITNLTTGQVFMMDTSFQAHVRAHEIFVFCLSQERSAELAKAFNTDVCVEIKNPAFFLDRIRQALHRRRATKHHTVLHGAVNYSSCLVEPGVAWALPDQIIMRKNDMYRWQAEYRVAFAPRGALDPDQVLVELAPPNSDPRLIGPQSEDRCLRIGSLKSVCRIHRF